MTKKDMPNGLGWSLTNGFGQEDVRRWSVCREDRRPLMCQAKNLSTVVGWVGLLVSLSFVVPPARVLAQQPPTLTAKCICDCGGTTVHVTPQYGTADKQTCLALTGQACSVEGKYADLKCDGLWEYARPKPPRDEIEPKRPVGPAPGRPTRPIEPAPKAGPAR